MKTLTFSKNSWHFKLARRFGGLTEFEEVTDFCSYTRTVMWAILAVLLITAVAIGFTIAAGDWLGWIVFMTLNGYISPSEPALIVSAIFGVIIAIGAMIGSMVWYEKNKTQKANERWKAINEGTYVEPAPGFIASAYASLKQKTCFKVELI